MKALSTGKIKLELLFDNGDVRYVYINPNDKELQTRINNFENGVNEKLKEIDIEKYKLQFQQTGNIELNISTIDDIISADKTKLNAIQSQIETLKDITNKYNKAVKDEIDIIFNTDMSSVAFKYCEPFDMVVYEDENGKEIREIYLFQFMKWLMQSIKEQSVQNSDAVNKYINKYKK